MAPAAVRARQSGDASGERMVVVGRISGLFGVHGWVKVYSYTHPPEQIFAYAPWCVGGEGNWQPAALEDGRAHGKGLIAKLTGCDDRDSAAALMGRDIGVPRSALPDPEPGEYYWVDLEGLRVTTPDGEELGRVERLMATGANDVLVVQGEHEHLVPFIVDEVVSAVDFERGEIRVDWDPDF